MLSLSSFDIIKRCYDTNIKADPKLAGAFASSPVKQQIDVLQELVEADGNCRVAKLGLLDTSCFVCTYRFQSGLDTVEQSVTNQRSLGIPAPTGWSKSLPVINLVALMHQWPAEYSKVPAIASTVSYAALTAAPELCDALLAGCIRAAFDMGGLQDSDYPGSVGPSDSIMKLFIETVKYQLISVSRPEWFDAAGKLVTDTSKIDVRSQVEIAVSVEAERVAERNRIRLGREAKRRDRRANSQSINRAAFLVGPVTQDLHILALRKEFLGMSFVDIGVRTEPKTWIGIELAAPYTSSVAPFPVGYKPSEAEQEAHEQAEDACVELDTAIAWVQHYILSAVADRKPAWFGMSRSGNYQIRRVEPRVSTYDRSARSIRNSVSKCIHKYGKEKVLEQLALFIKDTDAVLVANSETDDA